MHCNFFLWKKNESYFPELFWYQMQLFTIYNCLNIILLKCFEKEKPSVMYDVTGNFRYVILPISFDLLTFFWW